MQDHFCSKTSFKVGVQRRIFGVITEGQEKNFRVHVTYSTNWVLIHFQMRGLLTNNILNMFLGVEWGVKFRLIAKRS